MLRLALPVIAADLGWISMGLVDTWMVAPLGPAAIGAVGTGSIDYMAVMMVGFGTLFALDTFVSQSFGAGRIDECHRWLFAGLQLAAILSVVLTGVSLAFDRGVASVWSPSGRARVHAAVRGDPALVDAGPAGVRRIPPLSAGDARGLAGDGRARGGESREYRRELAAD